MASLGLSQEEFKSIEQTRQRLFQLSKGIESLKVDMINGNPLPPASSLQASAQILQKSMQSLLNIITENADLFQRLAVHPSANFPGRTQEGILLQLLRKKLEPDVEEWVAQGRDASAAVTPEGVLRLEALWTELRAWVKDRVREYVVEEANKLFTAEERAAGVKTVRTGLLRRDLAAEEDEEDDEDDDDDDEEEDTASSDEDTPMAGTQQMATAPAAAAPRPKGPEPELLFWYADCGDGEIPKGIDYESRKKAAAVGIPGMGR